MPPIDDNAPPRPKKKMPEVESGDGRKLCIACGKWHGSENLFVRCLEAEIVNLREGRKAERRAHEEELARVRREVRGESVLGSNPGGVLLNGATDFDRGPQVGEVAAARKP